MNFDKANSPLWVKVVIWTVIAAFFFGALAIGLTPLINNYLLQKALDKAGSGNADMASIEKTHLPGIKVVENSIESTESATVEQLTDLAIRYSNWSSALAQVANDDVSKARLDELLQRVNDLWLAAYEKSPSKEIRGDLATSYYNIGDVDTAIATAKELLKEYPDYVTVWFNLGYYQRETDPEAAIYAFEQAIKFDKDGSYTEDAQNQIDSLSAQLDSASE